MSENGLTLPEKLEHYAWMAETEAKDTVGSSNRDALVQRARVCCQAAARIAELEAVVEKLPKTADGACVTEGSKAFLMPPITFDDDEDGGNTNWYVTESEPEQLTLSLGSTYSYEDWAHASDLYSTPEAATEAAKKKCKEWNDEEARAAQETPQ